MVFESTDSFITLIDDDLIQIASNSVLGARGDYLGHISDINRSVSLKKSDTIGVLFEIIIVGMIICVVLACLMAHFRENGIKQRDENINILSTVHEVRKKTNSLMKEMEILTVENSDLRNERESIIKEKNIIEEHLSQLVSENTVMNSKINEISARSDAILREKKRLYNKLKNKNLENERLNDEKSDIILKI